MRKLLKIGGIVLGGAALGGLNWAIIGIYLDLQSVVVDVTNASGHPLSAVRVECAGPDGVRRQDLGYLVPGTTRTARFAVRYEGGSRWSPSFGTSYSVTLRFTGAAGRVVSSGPVARNRGGWAEFQVGDGDKIAKLLGQSP